MATEAQALPPAAEHPEPALPIIVVEGLSKHFGHVAAVGDACFSVAAGEVFGLIGPNGAGKSTMVRMLTTLLSPSAGRAAIAGYDIVREPAQVRRHIGYVPQLLSADGTLTGYENMLLSARLYNIPFRERRSRIAEALAAFNLTAAADRLARHYSGGMIRSLEIAQSLLHRPSVLFMDEPTVGLDPVARHAVWEHVRALRRSFSMTIFITTHYMPEADELCGRIAVLHRGRIAAVGTPAALKAALGPAATLDDVFAHYTGGEIDEGYAASRQQRLSAQQHG
jgi:ABC-2 type transport system ATP-binding protein